MPTTARKPSRLRLRSIDHDRRVALTGALGNVSYEVLPFAKTYDEICTHLPRTVALTVTTTEAKGLDATLSLAERLRANGYTVAPHIAARLVRDDAHLTDIVSRMRESDIDRIFAIGGDAHEPAGRFGDASTLLDALDESGHHFRSIGIGGYPEGHGSISDDLIERALESKAPHATEVITQLCFSPTATSDWARKVKARGVVLPVRVGIPGAVSRQKLVRISAGLGLGQSAKFLRKQQSMFWRFFMPGGYSPDRLIRDLTTDISQSDNNISGFHVFTFNELEATERWRREWLMQLSTDPR